LACRARDRRFLLCYFRALKIGNAAQVAPVTSSASMLVAIFGAIFLGG
jgi:transporter family protein